MDGPRAANSGHSGTAMALAPLATVLHTRVLRHDPSDPQWVDRDRFVLSAGHASILLYSMLHLSGYGVTLDDLRAFRQWGSATPGHPEVHHTPGVEVTTGPLGQGFANAVGMAVAERFLRARFGAEVMDHHTWVVVGDGCLQEGVSHEAASLAGHLGLGRMIAVYDDNHITIDGPTELAFTDDTPARFAAYGWHVELLGEIADDTDALEAALLAARARGDEGRPQLLVLRSHIGHPSARYTDTAFAHGNPFPPEEIAAVKQAMGLDPGQSFQVPDEALAWWRSAVAERATTRAAWERRMQTWSGDRAAWDACWGRTGLPGWADGLPSWPLGEKVATRAAVRSCVRASYPTVPGLLAGGADLTENVGLDLGGAEQQSREHPGGRQVLFGVREHGMGAALNGMALHGGVVPAGGTFFVFSDYLRPALRLAALSEAPAVYVLTHDSVGLGEDGPTHQPVEHLQSLRAMPQLRVLRPADANETAAAWRLVIDEPYPTVVVLTRQPVPVVTPPGAPLARGAYVLRDPGDGAAAQVVLIGTGSEVAVALAAADLLTAEGVAARVVSMPSWDRFAAQAEADRAEVLPPGVPRVSVEAGVTFGWERWADASVGIDRFGTSAPGAVALERLGITPDAVAAAARRVLARR